MQYKESREANFIVRDVSTKKGSLKLLCGDILNLQKSHVDGINVIYDHASYIALPKETRVKYAKMLTDIFPRGTKMLLGLFDHAEEGPAKNPPYVIEQEEIDELLSHKLKVHVFFENCQELFAGQSKQTAESKPGSSLEEVALPFNPFGKQQGK